jgi:HK97 family phage major capsid protein
MITLNDQTIPQTLDELSTLIEETVTKSIKSLPDRSQLKHLSLDGKKPRSKESEKIRKTFRFFSALAANDVSELRTIQSSYEPEYVKLLNPQVEGTSSAGGYLVPPEFYADVLFQLNEFGFARKFCAQVAMRTNQLNVSTLTGKPSVAWTDENNTIPASAATFGRLTLTAKKLAAIYPISNELLDDANIDIYNTILRIFVNVFTQEEDVQVFRGTGSPFTGILTTSGVNTIYEGGSSVSGKTKYTDITFDDLITLVQSLPPAQQRGASIFMEQNTLTDLLKRKDANSPYLWDLTNAIMPDVSGAQGLGARGLSFRGFPIVVLPNGVIIETYDANSHPETPFVIFGNLKTAGAWFGTHGGMDVRISHDATADGINAFTNDLQMLRMTERVAFGVGQPGYLSVLSTSAS